MPLSKAFGIARGWSISNFQSGVGDIVPDTFAFAATTNAVPSAEYVSPTVTITGIDAPSPVTVTGATVSLNGGAFGAPPATVVAGDQLRLSRQASAGYATAVSAVLNVGGVQATWVITTAAAPADSSPDPFSFVDVTGADQSTSYDSNMITVSGINVATPISITGGQYSKNSGAWTAAAGTVLAGDTVMVRGTSAAAAGTAQHVTLTIGDEADTFTITTAAGAFIVRRDLYVTSFYGSSTTSGNQDGTGVTVATALAAIPGAKAIYNSGAGGTDTSLTTGVRKTMSEASAERKAGTSIIQYDTNDWTPGSAVGIEITKMGEFISSAVTFLDAAAVSGKRFAVWVGTEYGYGSPANTRNRRWQRELWAQYPGQIINMQEYWARAPLDLAFSVASGTFAGATDTTSKANGQIPVSYQVLDRSHLVAKGYQYFYTAWEKDFVEAQEAGGCPFFAIFPYYTVLPTAQTLGGNVVQLQYVGTLAGVTLAVETLAGAAHPHFGVSASAMLTRVSGTVLKAQFEEFVVAVTRNGITKRYYQKVSIGSLTSAPQRKQVDGHVWGTLETNDYGGTLAAPTYDKTTARAWKGLGAGPFYELSIVTDYEPGTDGDDQYLFFQTSGIQIRRVTSNVMRVLVNGGDGASMGSISAAGAAVANGRQYWFYSAKVDAGAYQELIGDIGVAAARITASTPVPTKPNMNLNPLALVAGASVQTHVLGNSTPGQTNGVTMPTSANTVKGKMGFIWMAAAAIDFSVEANRLLFRSDLSSPVDLGTVSAGKRPGDGRSVIVQAGGRGLNVGATVTPFFYDRGGAADFGKNFGTGGDFEVWNRREPTGADLLQGIAQGI